MLENAKRGGGFWEHILKLRKIKARNHEMKVFHISRHGNCIHSWIVWKYIYVEGIFGNGGVFEKVVGIYGNIPTHISIHKVWNMLGGYLEMVGDIWKYLSSCLYIKYGNMWRGFLKLVVKYSPSYLYMKYDTRSVVTGHRACREMLTVYFFVSTHGNDIH